MKTLNLPIAVAIGGILVIYTVYITNELSNARVERTGINMITAAAVDRAGATITETKQPSSIRR